MAGFLPDAEKPSWFSGGLIHQIEKKRKTTRKINNK